MRGLAPWLCLAFLVHNPAGLAADESERVIPVPASLPDDASRDVTDELNAFFAELPNHSHVRFPEDARYRIDGTLLIENKERRNACLGHQRNNHTGSLISCSN
jgi:hypothetical protein